MASNAKRQDVMVQAVSKTIVERSQELLNFIYAKFPAWHFKSLFNEKYITANPVNQMRHSNCGNLSIESISI